LPYCPQTNPRENKILHSAYSRRYPPKKFNKETGEIKHPLGQGDVGIDIGTQTIAVCSASDVKLLVLAPSVENIEKRKRVLLRKLDRQRRANNPHKYNKDGTIKKDNKEKWIWSKNYIKTRNELAELQRKMADKRKQDHHQLANWMITLGDCFKVEKMNFKALQKRAKETKVDANGKYKKKKRFGKSIANRAPSLFLTILNQKLQYEDLQLNYIDTFSVKASQYDHQNNEYNKKTLSQRWHETNGCKIQRDLYSAFLIMSVKDNLKEIDRQKCVDRWDCFIHLHHKEMERLRLQPCVVSSMGV